MAIAKVKKIQLIAIAKHKNKILDTLQSEGILEIKEIEEGNNTYGSLQKLQQINLDLANVDFAIKTLSPFEKKKGFLAGPITLSAKDIELKAKDFDHQEVAKKCTDIEEEISQATNEIAALEAEIIQFQNWKSLNIDLENIADTKTTTIFAGAIKKENLEDLYQKINDTTPLVSLDVVKRTDQLIYIIAICVKDEARKVRIALSEVKFIENELPKAKGLIKDYLEKQYEKIHENKKEITKFEKELKKEAKNIDSLKITHDYLLWEQEKYEEDKKIQNTDFNIILNGWATVKNIKSLNEKLEKITKEFHIEEIKPEEGEDFPVILENNSFIRPFEAVTNIYGLPKYSEMDPTPFLALYFIVYFGLCLTDAGYGIIMFAAMALTLKFVKLEDGMKKLVKLLMYGGIATFIIGGLFGGWFGLTQDQVPASLTYLSGSGEKLFLLQKINSLTDPLTVLILSLGIGYFQILMGTYMKLIHELRTASKKDAMLGTAPWALMLTGIAFTILAATNVIPSSLMQIGTWWIYAATAILILTQGREKKSIIGKAISGILSLYGLIGYLSDVLSYSRLLALGLATAIIGLAVNIIAALMNDMIPYVGWIFMIIIFVGGHIFNLGINALGSFIHSGRLQFVEFFGKFMEGGGAQHKPFSKKSKYVYIKS